MKITGLTHLRRPLPDLARPSTGRTRCTGARTTRPRTSSSTPTIRRCAGHGLTFTNGRGTEVCVAAVARARAARRRPHARRHHRRLARLLARLVSEDQLRWLGPEKGVMHTRRRRGRERRLGSLGEEHEACRSGGCSPTCRRRRSCRAIDFRYIDGRAHARGGGRPPARGRAGTRGARGADRRATAIRRTPRRRVGSGTTTRRSRRSSRQALADGFRPREDEGRRRHRVGRPPGRARSGTRSAPAAS